MQWTKVIDVMKPLIVLSNNLLLPERLQSILVAGVRGGTNKTDLPVEISPTLRLHCNLSFFRSSATLVE